MPRFFDAYVMVDWSANSTPKTGKDSIWISWNGKETTPSISKRNPSTRKEAFGILEAKLVGEGRSTRILVGFDFAFGFPKGFARAIDSDTQTPWRSNWEAVHQRFGKEAMKTENSNCRFKAAASWNSEIDPKSASGPFWGFVRSNACQHRPERLEATRPTFPYPDETQPHFEDLRLCEKHTRGTRSVFQLTYAGSVGSQALLGIPVVEELRKGLEGHGVPAKIWPFETDFAAQLPQGPSVVFAEIWPGILRKSPPIGRVKDDWQVETLAAWFEAQDRDGRLAEMLNPALSPSDREHALEEGWILGAPSQRAAIDG